MKDPQRPPRPRRSAPRGPGRVALIAALSTALALGIALLAQEDPLAGYAPAAGHLLFQALPPGPLTALIEDATGAPYSHCGIVVWHEERWQVLEAIGTVHRTPLADWVARGRGQAFQAVAIAEADATRLGSFIAAAEAYLDLPYDGRYRLEKDAIYCSELIHHAWLDAGNQPLAPLVRLDQLAWQPHEALIRRIEGGPPPLARELITPVALARSERVRAVHATGIYAAPE
jgi:Permuted papain-like amidase enzyme, YaeF/YiiX, C92 family